MASSQHSSAVGSGSAPPRELAGDTRDIERVLEAEQDAERSVMRAATQGEQELTAARERARAIAGRTDRRIQHLHAHCSTRTDQTIEELYREHEGRMRRSERALGEEARLRACAERVAAWLLAPEDRGKA